MTTKQQNKIYTIDATGKKLGRVASGVAHHLMGKDDTSFVRHLVPNVTVNVTNVSKLTLPENKRKTKEYTRYSGYPGGLKIETMEEVIAKKGHREVMRRAVYNMLPSNKLRAIMMKRLIISN